MKNIVPLLFLLILCLKTNAKERKPPFKNTIYTAQVYNHVGIGLSIDSSTTWIDYNHVPANSPNQAYTFLEGTKSISLSISVPLREFRLYRYNIIADDSIWLKEAAKLSDRPVKTRYDDLLSFDIEKFNIEDKKLVVEVYKVGKRNQIVSAVIYNREIPKPKFFSMTAGLQVKTSKGVGVCFPFINKEIAFKIRDSATVLGLEVPMERTDVDFIYHVYLKNLVTGRSLLVGSSWQYQGLMDSLGAVPNMLINSVLFEQPGKYQIIIKPNLKSRGPFGTSAITPKKIAILSFTVLPSAPMFSQSELFLWIAGIAFTIGAIGFMLYKRRLLISEKKIQEEMKTSEIAQMRLESLRYQLNPHFLFNALSGIQNLINKNDVDQANRYLARFSRLTRSILESKNTISLEDELRILDDYLQMEQLRFGFKYTIEIGAGIDSANLEIPTMLLQPTVENAIKHGISDTEDGTIEVRVQKEERDLELQIIDNGKGYKTDQTTEGYGISLLKKRIGLLNKVYVASPLISTIESNTGKTVVSLRLTNWM